MKMLIAVALFLSSILVFAADQPGVAATESACGAGDVKFNVKTEKDHPMAVAQDGKALVYVVEAFDRPGNQLARPTTKVGLDGSWIGANKSNSYFSFSVEPGDHHLCTAWQSILKGYSRKVALTSFTAEPGKAYYFRARITEHDENRGAWFTLDLESVNIDEGQLLVASSAFSASHPKN
jgi:hypothetical protein